MDLDRTEIGGGESIAERYARVSVGGEIDNDPIDTGIRPCMELIDEGAEIFKKILSELLD